MLYRFQDAKGSIEPCAERAEANFLRQQKNNSSLFVYGLFGHFIISLKKCDMDKDEQDIITFNRRFRRAGRICRVLWLINLVLLILIRCTKW